MATGITKIELNQIGSLKFECINSAGKSAIIDGPSAIGGTEDGVRPMEMILMGLAGCSSFDVLSILKKQRVAIEDLHIAVEGHRADEVPSVFTAIDLHFTAKGDVPMKKLEKAVELSMEKYCSVSKMLGATVEIRHHSHLSD